MSDNFKLLDMEKKNYDDVSIPHNINDFIKTGIRKAEHMKRKSMLKKASAIAACFLLISFVTIVRISPVFADYLSDVPILKHIIKLINYDKGLKAAIENNFIQHINVYDEHEGIRFTVDSIIVDETRMVIFYTLENQNKYKVQLNEVSLLDESGNNIAASFSYSVIQGDASKFNDIISVSFTENTNIPDILTLKAQLAKVETGLKDARVGEVPSPSKPLTLESVWDIKIPIDKTKFKNMKQIYTLNETITVEGQKITFGKAVIYPTRIALEVEYDPLNTKEIFSFDDLQFIDEEGEVWAGIKNGITATHIDDNRKILYLESNYFKNPDKLYLKGSSIRALDKDKLEVVLDLVNKKLLKAPHNLLKLNGYTYGNSHNAGEETINLEFLLRKPERDESFLYSIFSSEFTDGAGNKYYDCGTSSRSTEGEKDYNSSIQILIPKNKEYVNPLTFTISDYPTRIQGEFIIEVK
ncbi:MAG: DUF4179 domain-containing protein [Bacillota bacterium]